MAKGRTTKIAAALAAVNAYLAAEAAARPATAAAPSRGPSLWALAGRLRLMNDRLALATGRR